MMGLEGKRKMEMAPDMDAMPKRKILIFASATDIRVNETIEEAKKSYGSIYLVAQSKRADVYRNQYKFLNLIETKADFIGYKLLMEENKIPAMTYDAIWIPSSNESNLSSFGEVIAAAITIRNKGILWKGAGGKEIAIDSSVKDKIKDACYSCIAWAFYMYGKISTMLYSKMKGYRW